MRRRNSRMRKKERKGMGKREMEGRVSREKKRELGWTQKKLRNE